MKENLAFSSSGGHEILTSFPPPPPPPLSLAHQIIPKENLAINLPNPLNNDVDMLITHSFK